MSNDTDEKAAQGTEDFPLAQDGGQGSYDEAVEDELTWSSGGSKARCEGKIKVTLDLAYFMCDCFGFV